MSTKEASLDAARKRLARAADSGNQLDITRGKPSPEQLDLADGLIECVSADDWRSPSGIDTRNYGGLEGLREACKLFADYLEVPSEAILVQDNSSLRLMFDTLTQATLRGVVGSARPWCREGEIKFLCPIPGYDRHFFALAHCGIEMVPVAMGEDGPDMEKVSRLAGSDPTVRGMFCVPRHSNPTGATYSAEVVRQIAEMKTAAPDFRVFWDNAYMRHHLVDSPQPLADLLSLCANAGNPDRAFLFGSTSKISLAGGGVSMMAGSPDNVAWWKHGLSRQSIGPDKVNQLRHVRFFGDLAGIERHLAQHSRILRPKFAVVEKTLNERLGATEERAALAEWTQPEGGYFVSLDVPEGCATAVVGECARAGVKLTAVGATFPHGDDPRDRNIRIAPSFPALDELEEAMRVLCDAVVVTVAEQST